MTENNRHVEIVRELAATCGILPEFWNIEGKRTATTDETRIRLLAAMGVPCCTEKEAEDSRARLHRESWERMLPPVVSGEEKQDIKFDIRLPREAAGLAWRWEVEHETDGPCASGLWRWSDDLIREQADVEGRGYARLEVRLPAAVPCDYHRLLWQPEEAGDSAGSARVLLLIAPAHCYVPEEMLSQSRRIAGISTQLYSLPSARNWGMGDFTDLRNLTRWTSGMGMQFIGLNPLHAVSPRGDAGTSPYSPVSRVVLNPLYIDILSAGKQIGAAEILKQFCSPELLEEVASLRSEELVPYEAIAPIKLAALESLYTFFRDRHLGPGSKLAHQFLAFCGGRGEELELYGVYCALAEHFCRQNEGSPEFNNWMRWPEEYHDWRSPAVGKFARDSRERIDFYKFVEWIADAQLGAVRKYAGEQGMSVGLYLDVALGASGGGAEAWVNRGLYAFGASMGAPPDLLAPDGQDWGLPPFNPLRLRDAEYRPWMQMLRAAMRYAGAVRIDHAMSLMRLYWVPGPGEAKRGAYVLYPLDDLMAVLAIESQRSKCLVIGEDLGTVPDEVRHSMARRRVLSYKVLYFMKDYEKEKFFVPLQYQPVALVVTSTHDLPTLRGYFEERDLIIRRELKLHADDVLDKMWDDRRKDREALLDVLVELGFLPAEDRQSARWKGKEMPPELVEKVHLMLAGTPCVLQAVQLEDILNQEDQPNLPGTTSQHPNWQRRLRLPLEKLTRSRSVRALLEKIVERRKEACG